MNENETLLFEIKAREAAERFGKGEEYAPPSKRSSSDLLPICMNCRKVRDLKGRWVDREKGIKARRDIQYTHSFCPACVRKLYPDLGKTKKSRAA